MSVINATPLLAAAGGDYQISRSVRLRSSAGANLTWTPSAAGNRRMWTYSFWHKVNPTGNQNILGAGNVGVRPSVELSLYHSAASSRLNFLSYNGSAYDFNLQTTASFRDPSAWYHFVIAFDTAQATAANRIKIYVNNVLQTAFQTASYPSQNFDGAIGNNVRQVISTHPFNASGDNADGYLTEVNFIDGQALTPSSFGETDSITGVWKPKKYAGTYGTNGFYLNFSDNSSNTATTIGKDYSGNGNNWTPNNISVTSGVTYDSMLDVPTLYADGGNGRGNYCVGNPLYAPSSMSKLVMTNGNLGWGNGGTNANMSGVATIPMTSGKYYWEVTATEALTTAGLGIQTDINTAWRGGGTVLYSSNGQKIIGGTASAYGASYTTNDVIGFAYDADAGTLTCYKNNTSQGVIYSSGAGSTWLACMHNDNFATSYTFAFNFGQRPFSYTPPTGFKALNTQNLPEPTIKKGNQYFDATTWAGNSASRNIQNSGSMQPDLVWIKDRSTTAWHVLFDAQRGTGKELNSNSTSAETTNNIFGYLNSFNSDGFGLVSGSTGYDNVNKTGDSYVGWQWKESAAAGFDIVTYTGTGSARTVAHGLGVKPAMIIAKRRNSTDQWQVTHQALNMASQGLYLNSTIAAFTDTDQWNNTQPTSTVFSLGAASGSNVNAATYVAYLFSEVAGFSRFGSYTGNGSADGPFVFTGFRPKFVLIKYASGTNAATAHWEMKDTSRDTYNAAGNTLFPNLSNAESAGSDYIDILSNGFKLRGTGYYNNESGGTYIFMAFAESPFRNSLAR